jgi:hypothetical protein
VRPFFQQNVEISAWGLAIHKNSRLIAVGTNKHNVHVFAFGLTDLDSDSDSASLRVFDGSDAKVPNPPELFLHLTKNSDGRLSDISEILSEELDEYDRLFDRKMATFEKHPLFLNRKRGYRIIIQTDEQGNNIPNVAFTSNPDGDADEVLAIDISGNIWVMNIWSLDERRLLFVEGLHRMHHKSVLHRTPGRRVPIE